MTHRMMLSGEALITASVCSVGGLLAICVQKEITLIAKPAKRENPG